MLQKASVVGHVFWDSAVVQLSGDAERDIETVRLLEALRDLLGPEDLEAALARGAEMDLDHVVAQILASA